MNITVLDRSEQGRKSLLAEIGVCLSGTGVTVDALDSFDALQRGRLHTHAVLLAMTDMLDVEVGRKLKRLFPELPLVLVGTNADFSVEAFALNAKDYLVRPLRREALLKALRRCQSGSG